MEIAIAVLFIGASLGLLLIVQKRTNSFAMVHILFCIIFVQLLHFVVLLSQSNQHYDIVYYFLAHLSVLLYLVIFTLGYFWFIAHRLISPQEKLFNSIVHFPDGLLIAAFCGWLLIKTYLVTVYGVSAFSFFAQLAGKHAVTHYSAWWETPMESYLRSFAMGASVIYVVKAVSIFGYWRKSYWVTLAFMLFVSISIGTHATIIGPRRYMLILALVALVAAATGQRKSIIKYLSQHWKNVLITGVMLFALTAYYQSVRNNYFQPEIANKLTSGNLVTFVKGFGQGLIPLPRDKRIGKDTTLFRSGPLRVIYQVIERRNDENLGTGGDISVNAFRMVIPRIILGQDKKDINADEFLENKMSITPDGPYLASDVATSLLAIFMADFGFIGIVIAPMVILFSIVFFLKIPQKGLLAHPLMTLFYFSSILNLVANVEGSLVSVLSIFRDLLVLAIVLSAFSLVGGKLFIQKMTRFKTDYPVSSSRR